METPIITFYSYKGGAGRTTTTANTIPFFVKEFGISPERPMLIVDFDLESAGLTYFYKLQNKFYGAGNCDDTRSIHSFKVLKSHDFLEKKYKKKKLFGKLDEAEVSIDNDTINMLKDYIGSSGLKIDVLEEVKLKENTAGLFKELIEADKQNPTRKKNRKLDIEELCQRIHGARTNPIAVSDIIEEALPLMQFADISSIYRAEAGSVFFLGVDDTTQNSVALNDGAIAIESLRSACEEYGFGCIVFDSGSGRQSSAHVLHQTSDILVYCMRPTQQFRIGTANNLAYYNNPIEKAQKKRREDSGENLKSVIVLPTAVPQQDSKFSAEAFRDIEDNLVKTNENIIDATFCTPQQALCEVQRFKWSECILFNNESTSEDEKQALVTYAMLGKVVRQNL